MDVVVDDLDIPNERAAWQQAASDLDKPVYLRSELEVSRIMTLLSRLRFLQPLTFAERFALSKIATFYRASPGEVLLTARGNPLLDEDENGDFLAAANFGLSSPAATNAVGGRSPTRGGVPEAARSAFVANVLGTGGRQSPRAGGSSAAASGSTTATTAAPTVASPRQRTANVVAPLSVSVISNASGGGGYGGEGERPSYLFVVVSGSVAMRIDGANGRVQSLLEKGDPVGNPLVLRALPPRARFVANEHAELLRFSFAQIEEQVAKLDAAELRQRVAFFKALVVPVLSPWTDAEFERLARLVYPLRVQSKELLVRERDVADCMYFIASGKVKVVREIDFVSGAASAADGGGAKPPVQHPPPLVRLLELAALNEGEFFGELALLRYNVDANRRTRLARMAPADLADFDAELRDRDDDAGLGTSGGGAGDNLDDEDSDGDADEATRIARLSRPPLLRQATVFAHTPTTVLVLPRACFVACFTGPALVRLREYARGYPSQQEIRAHFQRQQRWERFKGQLVHQVHRSNGAVAGSSGGGSGAASMLGSTAASGGSVRR